MIERTLDIASDPSKIPAEAMLRVLVEREPPNSGEVRYALDRYLRERGDRNIRSVRDLLEQSTFYDHATIEGVTLPPRRRLEGLLTRTQQFTRKSDGSPFTQRTPIATLDVSGWHVLRTTLQMLVNKVMADNGLDALVYPTKTIPAPLLANPVEPAALKSVKDTITATIDGQEYQRTADRAIDVRAPLTWRLSPNSGYPAIAAPAGFTREVYDRAVVRGEDGAKKAGELVGPKAVALPVSIDFLGRPLSEPLLIRIAAAYEKATRHRRPPKDFGPVAGEP